MSINLILFLLNIINIFFNNLTNINYNFYEIKKY